MTSLLTPNEGSCWRGRRRLNLNCRCSASAKSQSISGKSSESVSEAAVPSSAPLGTISASGDGMLPASEAPSPATPTAASALARQNALHSRPGHHKDERIIKLSPGSALIQRGLERVLRVCHTPSNGKVVPALRTG